MFKPKHYVTFCVSVAFWLVATWYWAWSCDITGRTHLAKIGLQIAGMVAVLGLYALIGGAGFAGSKYAPPREHKYIPGSGRIGLSILAAAAACALFSALFLF
jgi:heme/copper-type cytochrome/quinol oxidase subunit 1